MKARAYTGIAKAERIVFDPQSLPDGPRLRSVGLRRTVIGMVAAVVLLIVAIIAQLWIADVLALPESLANSVYLAVTAFALFGLAHGAWMLSVYLSMKMEKQISRDKQKTAVIAVFLSAQHFSVDVSSKYNQNN